MLFLPYHLIIGQDDIENGPAHFIPELDFTQIIDLVQFFLCDEHLTSIKQGPGKFNSGGENIGMGIGGGDRASAGKIGCYIIM